MSIDVISRTSMHHYYTGRSCITTQVPREDGLLVRCFLVVFLIGSLIGDVVSAAEKNAIDTTLEARSIAERGETDLAYKVASGALILAVEEFGPLHAYIAFIEDDLAKYSLYSGEISKALVHSSRAIEITRNLGSAAGGYRDSILFNHASVLAASGRYPLAIPFFKEIYTTRSGSAASVELASVSEALGYAYLEDRKPALAIKLLDESAGLLNQLGLIGTAKYVKVKLALAKANLFDENPDKSIDLINSLKTEISDKLFLEFQSEILTMEARINIQLSYLDIAENQLDRAISLIDSDSVSHSAALSSAYYNLAHVNILRGNPIAAEQAFKKSLATLPITTGELHPENLPILHGLAIVSKNLGKLSEADNLFARVVNQTEEVLGVEHLAVAESLSEWSRLMIDMNDNDEATVAARRALQITLGDDNSTVFRKGIAHNALGFAYKARRQHDDAIDHFKSGISYLIAARGERSSDLPPGYIALTEIYIETGQFELATNSIGLAYEIVRKDKSDTTDRLGKVFYLLARIDQLQHRCKSAAQYSLSGLRTAAEYSFYSNQQRSSNSDSRTRTDRKLVEDILAVYSDCGYLSNNSDEYLRDFLYGIQIPHLKTTTSAIAQMAERFIPGNADLNQKLKARQDMINEWKILDQKALRLLSSDSRIDNGYTDLVEIINSLEVRIETITGNINTLYPDYSNLVTPSPVDYENIQGLLKSDEAVLLQLTTSDGTYLVLIKMGSITIANTGMTSEVLANTVESIRAGLNSQDFNSPDSFPEFDFQGAHYLFESTIQPFMSKLESVEHLIVIPDGALQRIPMSLLLTEIPTEKPTKLRGYRTLSYLINRFSLSILPSLGSLKILRDSGEPLEMENQKYIGFGDPIFRDTEVQGVRGLDSFSDYAESFTDPELLRASFSRLKETADELVSISEFYPKGNSKIYLQEDATEANIRTLDLSGYSVIAFATHGLMADELASVREPSLIFTPPDVPTEQDDGILTASEIAGLHLNADWVILSACNTASPVADIGADGLSGLSRAFFYAGGRSLLVSHWWVNSKAAQILTTKTLGYYSESKLKNKAQALREAMLYLIRGEAGGNFAHPVFWAPFVHVGDSR